MQINVNGEIIPNEVFQAELQNATQANQGANPEDVKQLTLHRIVEWTLIRQEAKKQDIPVWGPEVDAEYDKLCQAHGGKDAFFQRFGMTGKDEGRVKEDIEMNLKTQRFLDLVAKDVEKATDEAISDFYEANKQFYIKPEQAHVQHIVKHPKNEQEAEAATEALRALRVQLLDGADFMEVANAHSECNDSSPDLGFFMKGQMTPPFECVVFSMNVGEISPVFQTQFGLHIAKVLAKLPASQAELNECREDIENRLFQAARNKCIGEWVAGVRANAKVEISED